MKWWQLITCGLATVVTRPLLLGGSHWGGAGLWLFGRVLGLWGVFFGVKQLLLRGIHCPAGGQEWSLRA